MNRGALTVLIALVVGGMTPFAHAQRDDLSITADQSSDRMVERRIGEEQEESSRFWRKGGQSDVRRDVRQLEDAMISYEKDLADIRVQLESIQEALIYIQRDIQKVQIQGRSTGGKLEDSNRTLDAIRLTTQMHEKRMNDMRAADEVLEGQIRSLEKSFEKVSKRSERQIARAMKKAGSEEAEEEDQEEGGRLFGLFGAKKKKAEDPADELGAYLERKRAQGDQWETAEQVADERLQSAEDDEANRLDQADGHYRAGAELLRNGELEQAKAEFEKALVLNPGLSDARFSLASSYYTQGDIQAARERVEDLLYVEPKHAKGLGLLGVIQWREGDLKSSEKTLRKAIKQDKENSQWHNYLGIVLHENGENRAALKELRKAVELNPLNGEAQYNLAVLLAKMKRPDLENARIHYEESLRLGNKPNQQLERVIYVETEEEQGAGFDDAGKEKKFLGLF